MQSWVQSVSGNTVLASGSETFAAGRCGQLPRLLREEIVAVTYDAVNPMTTLPVDASLVGLSAADETVRKNAIVLSADPHAMHAIAVSVRRHLQVSRPALISGPR